MRLDEFIEDFERDETAERRRLAREKSYEITDHLDDDERQFEQVVQGDSLFGSTAPEIFVGRSNYPDISTGVLSPMDREADATQYATSGEWYQQGLGVEDVLQRRTGLLNSTHSARVNVEDVWDGFVGVQREVAIADTPVDVELGLDGNPDLDLSLDDISTPTGPRARATDATLAENPSVPRAVEKTLEDDDWQADGAMTYLYRRGFDVYDINTILSAGALGRGQNRRLVPTRWSITAVDDTVGKYLRGSIRNAASTDEVQVWYNEYMANDYWIILAPGNWEFELVELKAPGSIWNPGDGDYYMAADNEAYGGRDSYVDETSGAYYATRLGVLEHLADIDRQATCLVIRHASDGYWAPVGVWQIREGIRHAFEDGQPAVAETFHDAIRGLAGELPVSLADLRRKSELVAGVQSQLTDF